MSGKVICDPATPETYGTWQPVIRWKALNRDVLAVANSRCEGAWCAYIGAVPGMHHDNEWQEIRAHGGKLSEHIARVIFPEFEGPYAR